MIHNIELDQSNAMTMLHNKQLITMLVRQLADLQ